MRSPADSPPPRRRVAPRASKPPGGSSPPSTRLLPRPRPPSSPREPAPSSACWRTATTIRKLAARLLEPPGPEELEDWRLYALADARADLHRSKQAAQALETLLAAHPDSLLRPRALVRLADLAGEAGDLAEARRRIAQGRAERLPAEEAVELERTAWKIGLERDALDLLSESGRRLLVLAPLEASKLRVVDTLGRRADAGGDWRLWLSPDELSARSRALLDEELPAGALTTLIAIPEAKRGLEWKLLEARALTDSGRAADGFVSLADAMARTPHDRARLAWRRAEASRVASRPRRGSVLAVDAVERYRRQAREQWLATVREEPAGELARPALRALFTDYLHEAKLDEAVATLRQLVALDPGDRTGARPLWEEGWDAYQRHDPRAALALWRPLVDLYPTASAARSARYWMGRSLDRLGRAREAKVLYLEILGADTADFYARQAALRLAGSNALAAAPPTERNVWPTDPALARAGELSELGLDDLARSEIELVGGRADRRAAAALTAVVLARSGDRRASLGALRRAFPDLGSAHQAHLPNKALELYHPTDFHDTIAAAAAAEQLPSSLVFGIVHQESAFDPSARSFAGARGLMQLMPSTGRELAQRMRLPFSYSRLLDPAYSVRLGSRYFRQLMDRFDGRVELALASYNGGPGRISRLWRAAGPDPELDRFLEGLSVDESRDFVKRILILAETYRSLYPDLG